MALLDVPSALKQVAFTLGPFILLGLWAAYSQWRRTKPPRIGKDGRNRFERDSDKHAQAHDEETNGPRYE